jgi:hypothetical protein
MKETLQRLLGVEREEIGPVSLLLVISFLMGLFLATVAVASQTLFLNHFDEGKDLPLVLMVSGAFGLVATWLYNRLQGRIPFTSLAIINLLAIIVLVGFIEFGAGILTAITGNEEIHFAFGFALVLPFTFISQLIFWGAFGRIFNLRQAKRVIGSVDVGMDIASIFAFFTIPVLLNFGVPTDALYTISLFSVIGFLVCFILLSKKYLRRDQAGLSDVGNDADLKKLGLMQFFKSRYLVAMAVFVVVSTIALRFIDYSFYNVTTARFSQEQLPYFLSLFEATIVIFGFLFATFGADRITSEYGLRVSLLLNPIILIVFTTGALALGLAFGYETGNAVIFFFIMIAMSKLFVNSLKGAMDDPVLKMYYIPIDKRIKLDAQTKMDGIVAAIASIVAGGLIVLINQFEIFDLLSITFFTLVLLGLWYWVTNRMHKGYRETLQNSLQTGRSAAEKQPETEYTLDSILDKEVHSTVEGKVIYGLKLMERMEPALFETSLLQLREGRNKKLAQFSEQKMAELGLGSEQDEMKGLAAQASAAVRDSDLLSISVDKLMKLSKAPKQADRLLAAKLLRQAVSTKTIFILLELLRDADPKVRREALLTARKIKRPETWPLLIELLSSPAYSHEAAAALKEAGAPALPVLESAFHKAGQTDLVMLKIVQIMGSIGGEEGISLLWKKADFPDKRIVKQILFSLRYRNYRARGREATMVKDLLDAEMAKTLWNLAAIEELPNQGQFVILRQALSEETRENYDQIALLLSLIYDPHSVQLVRENMRTATPDSIQYALELLDLFLEQDLKPKLIPLLDDTPTTKKIDTLQTYFPREKYNPVQVINYVLNRDFNYNNRWTKACAIHLAAYLPDFRVSRGLISQLFNPDKLLQETAAWVIYNKDKQLYEAIAERLPSKDKKFLDSSIANNQLLDGLDDGFFLEIEMVFFLQQVPAFRGIPGNFLTELADKIQPMDVRPNELMPVSATDDNPILIVAHGMVEITLPNGEKQTLQRGDVYGDIFSETTGSPVLQTRALQRSVIFKINLADFYIVMANHYEMVQAFLNNRTPATHTTR